MNGKNVSLLFFEHSNISLVFLLRCGTECYEPMWKSAEMTNKLEKLRFRINIMNRDECLAMVNNVCFPIMLNDFPSCLSANDSLWDYKVTPIKENKVQHVSCFKKKSSKQNQPFNLI